MSNDVRYVLLKLYISNSINDIENVFNQTKHNYSPFQCEKMEEALIEARSLLAEINLNNVQSEEAFLTFGQRFHTIFDNLNQY
jgi:hypothetical protein